MTAFLSAAPMRPCASACQAVRCIVRPSSYRRILRASATPPPSPPESSSSEPGANDFQWPKFDPKSDKDAFGRDPRKETEFWRESARQVLDSQEIRDAIEEHASKPSGANDDREAYLKFISELDGEKEST